MQGRRSAFWLKVVDIVDAAMNEALFGQLVDKLRVAAGERSMQSE